MKSQLVAALVGPAALLAAAAVAQDSYVPEHGMVELFGGGNQREYPHAVTVRSGGPIDIYENHPNCAGYAEALADFGLFYHAAPLEGTVLGEYPPYHLHIYVKAAADTTLLVRTPSGNWVCSDDANGHNPHVEFFSPETGQYAIWVGTFGETSTHDAELFITDGTPQW